MSYQADLVMWLMATLAFSVIVVGGLAWLWWTLFPPLVAMVLISLFGIPLTVVVFMELTGPGLLPPRR